MATAMEDTTLRIIPSERLFAHLTEHSLLENFVQYLTARVSEQQQIITYMVTVDSEHRLGETLLALARKLGQPDPPNTLIEHKITHEELSEMVGTTRPRITEFMTKFRGLGLIDWSAEHFLIVREPALNDYLARTN